MVVAVVVRCTVAPIIDVVVHDYVAVLIKSGLYNSSFNSADPSGILCYRGDSVAVSAE